MDEEIDELPPGTMLQVAEPPEMPPLQERGFLESFDLSQDLARLRHLIRGDRQNFDTGKWIDAEYPYMNDAGINAVMADVTANCSRIATWTQYNDNEIRDVLIEVFGVIKNNMFDNIYLYDLNINQMELILDMVTNFLRNLYNAAKEGKLIRAVTTVRHEQETTSIQKAEMSTKQSSGGRGYG
jgi:hypothetical protein